jgi:site-specific DNA-adenine methylase
MIEGAKKSGFDFYTISDRFDPVDVDESIDVDVNNAGATGKPVSVDELDFVTSDGLKYVKLLKQQTTYIDAFNMYCLPDPDTFAWLVPYTGNQHNRTFFTHLVISAVARQIALRFQRRPTLIEPFAGTGQIFLNSGRTLDLFNGGQALFCGVVGGDLNHYLIASYTVMSLDAKFVELYTVVAAKLDRNPETAFAAAREWLDLHGKTSALGDDAAAQRDAAYRYIYLVNRCVRGSSLNKAGGLSVKRNPKLDLSSVRERETRTLTNVVAQLKQGPCELQYRDFEVTCRSAQPGDMVVMDCPFPKFTYFDKACTDNSSTYGTGDSGTDLQNRITKTARKLAAAGVTVLLCNYANPSLLRDYADIGARVIFTYKRPTTKSEVYQLALLPALIHGIPIDMDRALEVIKGTWQSVSKDQLCLAPRLARYEHALRTFFGLFKKRLLFAQRNPGKCEDRPGVTQGTVSQFWVPGGEVACSPMATLAIAYLFGLGDAGPVTADDIDNILLDGTLLYKRMASSARDEQDLMRALAMSQGESLEPGVAPGDAPYFNPVDIPDDALATRRLTVQRNVSLNHDLVCGYLRSVFPSLGPRFGIAIVVGGYTVSITRVRQRIFLFDSHGWGTIDSAFVREYSLEELDLILILLNRMFERRAPKSAKTNSISTNPMSPQQGVKDVNLTFFVRM